MQIKYLRVPETLLDVVKEDQNRARDANRNSRGGHTSGGEDTNVYRRKSKLTDAIVSVKVVVLREEASLGVGVSNPSTHSYTGRGGRGLARGGRGRGRGA
jgi:hypothetical protein